MATPLGEGLDTPGTNPSFCSATLCLSLGPLHPTSNCTSACKAPLPGKEDKCSVLPEYFNKQHMGIIKCTRFVTLMGHLQPKKKSFLSNLSWHSSIFVSEHQQNRIFLAPSMSMRRNVCSQGRLYPKGMLQQRFGAHDYPDSKIISLIIRLFQY